MLKSMLEMLKSMLEAGKLSERLYEPVRWFDISWAIVIWLKSTLEAGRVSEMSYEPVGWLSMQACRISTRLLHEIRNCVGKALMGS